MIAEKFEKTFCKMTTELKKMKTFMEEVNVRRRGNNDDDDIMRHY